jgi:glycosyltransferase involved in cell wall biosynthesis
MSARKKRYIKDMSRVIIAVENLRIGGYQRLALDQAYYLSDISYPATLLLLNPESPNLKSFEHSEANLIMSKNLKMVRLSGRRFSDLFTVRKILTSEKTDVIVISHSMRSTVLFSFARLGLAHKVIINTTIHQLPTLSKFNQRIKRFCYSQFGDHIFAYSVAVKKDWEARFLHFGKRICVLRNGIYAKRLNYSRENSSQDAPRLIFLGRNTSWKGIDTYFKLFNLPIFSEYEGLMMIANSTAEIQDLANKIGSERIKIFEGANLADFEPRENDLHIYPSHYGEDAKFTEPISLNCLEMALLGIPSLVTSSNEHTWPELNMQGAFIEVVWERVDESQNELKKKISGLKKIDKNEVFQLISISNNVNRHLNTLS